MATSFQIITTIPIQNNFETIIAEYTTVTIESLNTTNQETNFKI
jgi:hypothetical protein